MNESSPTSQNEIVEVSVGMPARDQIKIRLEVRGGQVVTAHLSAIGCIALLELVSAWRDQLKGPLAELPLPPGSTHGAILLREVLLRSQGRWAFPYQDEELCHCRAVPTKKVDAAIIGGCHTVDAVKSATSASTSCGTCRPDVERVISYRLSSAS